MWRIIAGFLFVILIAGVSTSSAEQIQNPPIVDGTYMTIQNGCLSYNGQRVRFWGVNFCASVKRGGKDLELSFDRMADAGFNGVRFNLNGRVLSDKEGDVTYKVPVTVKGTDSQMERLDYAIYLARQRGMFFWMQFDRLSPPFKPGDYDLLPDDGTREQWNEVVREDADRRWRLPNNLVYVYPRAGKIFMEYAKNVLDHVNPYTGRRYGDEETIALWEIFNENLFVQDFAFGNAWSTLPEFLKKDVTRRWNVWLRRCYKDDAGLKKAWGELRPGESLVEKTVAYAPIFTGAKLEEGAGQAKIVYTETGKDGVKYPYRRSEDVVRFAVWMYRDYVRKFTAFFRTQGKGAAVVPLAPTGCFEQTAAQYYSVMDGDYVTNGTYGFAFRAWELRKDDPYYPFKPRVNQHPMMGQPSDVMRAAGKPYLIYECNDYRPNPYMIEYPIRIATSLIALDADGAFFFYWDDDGHFGQITSDEDVLKYPLPLPRGDYPNNCLVMVNDEAYLAAVKAAGAIFRQANLPRPKRVRVVIGKDRMFNFSKPSMDDLVHSLRFSAWRTGVNIVYDPRGETKLPTPPEDWRETSCNQGPYTRFEWKDAKGFIRIDSPTCKAQVGFNPSDLSFGDVKVTGLNRKFSWVSIVAEDGRPLEESTSILISLAADSTNTGYKLDPEKFKGAWGAGLAEAVVNSGTTPILVNRVSATVTAPWLKGKKFQKHDFLRNVYATGTVEESFAVSADEPIFYARLTSAGKKTVNKMLVIGNSITHHDPSETIQWTGNWGMAASAEGKDFAHLLHKKLCEAQGGSTPELVVKNLADRGLEQKTAEFQTLGDIHADLIIVQIGDNLSPEKANAQTLGEPYGRLLKTLRQTNPDAVILGVSTWGGGANRDDLMAAACKSQAVPFVRIDHLIRDPKNMAKAEGRFEHHGVNWHPGDAGMQAIADTIWPVAKSQLQP